MNASPWGSAATRFPNGAIFVDHDGDALNIINDAGRIEHLPKRQGSTVVRTHFEYRGYWCMAQFDYDHLAPDANGYSVIALPMGGGETGWTRESAGRFFLDLAVEDCIEAGGDPLTNFHVGFKPLPKKGNQ